MSERSTCPNCGAALTAASPRGLCPRCLLRRGLPIPAEFTISFEPARPGHVLESLAETFGPLPRVLLPDTSQDETAAVVRPSSGEMPPLVDRSARYQLFGEIARGGMGAVLRGRDPDLGRELAVKVLLDVHKDNPDLVRRFVEEAQIGGQLQHPGIVPVYEFGAFADARPYFTMKLVKGRTLAEVFAARPDPSHDRHRLVAAFLQVAQTIAYAHARGVIHRDLKPSNVMVGSFGEVQVMDWGLAKVLPRGGATADAAAGVEPSHTTIVTTARSADDSDASRAGSILGTPAYMPPEQALGEIDRIDERADVFALGAILCEILTGRPPYVGRNSAETLGKARRADLTDAFTRLDASDADPELGALTKSCLAAEPLDRPRDASAVAESLNAHLDGVEARLRRAEIDRARAETRAVEERRRRKWQLGLAASVLALVALGGGVAAWQYQLRQGRVAGIAATLARVQTLGDLARDEGVDSNRRREALAAAEQAVATLGDLASSDPGRRLVALRAKLAEEQEQADRDRQLVDEITAIRTFVDPHEHVGQLGKDEKFAVAFRKYGTDLSTLPIVDSAARYRSRPEAFQSEVIATLDLWMMLLTARSESGDPPPGQPSLRQLLELSRALDPNPERIRLRGLLESADLPSQLPTLRALASDPKLFDLGPSSPVLLAILLKRATDTETATQVLRKAALRFPGDVWVNFELAGALKGSEPPQLEEAARHYTVVRALRPSSGLSLAELLESQGKQDERIALLEEMIRVDPENLRVVHELWMEAWGRDKNPARKQELGKQMRELVRARMLARPENPEARMKLAQVSQLTGDRDGAIAVYRDVARLHPDHSECHAELGRLFLEAGDLPAAAAEYRRAIQCSPAWPQHHSDLAAILGKMGDPRGEIAELREAVRLEELRRAEGPSVEPSYRLDDDEDFACTIGAGLDGWFAAIRWKLGLHRGSAYEALGDTLMETGDVPGAIAAYQQGCAALPEDGSQGISRQLGDALRATGDFEGAIAAYRKAIPLDKPNQDVKSQLGLGLALAESGDLTSAAAALRAAVRMEQERFHRFDLLQMIARSARPAEALAALERVRVPAQEDAAVLTLIDRTCAQYQELARRQVLIPPILRGGWNSNSLPQILYDRQFHRAAAAVWSAGFVAEPALADDMRAQNRYNAACAATLAGCGKGNDAPADESARAGLREQALAWLKADLAFWSQQLETDQPEDRNRALEVLRHWRKDADLASIRDAEALASLPEPERQQWQGLWGAVDALLKPTPKP